MSNDSFIFPAKDGIYIAHRITETSHAKYKWHRRVEFLFSQIFGASAVLATSAAVWYLLAGNGPACVLSAVVSSVCSSLFWKRLQ